ncbi:MAG: DPP IV N-terminal domain-containing protein [Planctomycetaceae bacterium]|nr:DPP IV N-terminal domain-containing protein [Planctomycetaceae bacterium]
MPILGDVSTRIVGFFLAVLATANSFAAEAPTAAKAIFAMNADGTGWRKFFQLPQLNELGPPAVSRDGQRIAFEGSAGFQKNSVFQNDSARASHVFVVNTTRTEMRILGLGALPSWGPNDQQLACSFYAKGIGLLNVDSQELTWIDSLGWGVQWSPDGKDVAYVNGPELWFYEVATKNKRQVLKSQPDYVQLLPNFAWSPDGKQIAIVGRKDHLVRDILLVSLADGKPQVTKRITGRTPGDKLAWHPTTPRLVFSEAHRETRRRQLWEVNPTTDAPPQLLAGQETLSDVHSPCWSPDGKTLFCVADVKSD